MVHRDVAPEQESLPVAAECALDIPQVLDVHGADGRGIHARLGLALAEFEGLIRAEMHERSGEHRIDLGEDRPSQFK